jgi:hypothetical protein
MPAFDPQKSLCRLLALFIAVDGVAATVVVLLKISGLLN